MTMTSQQPTARLSDVSPNISQEWFHDSFIVQMGDDFKTYIEAYTSQQNDELYGGGGGKAAPNPVFQSVINSVDASSNQALSSGANPTPAFYSKGKCRDTTLGGNDAINCYYQYCENDDITHPFTYEGTKNRHSESPGMGRVYSETIDDNQQIMYLSFGIPIYNNLTSFYANAVNPQMADLINRGPSFVSIQAIAHFSGAAVGWIVAIPVLPLVWINLLLNGKGDATKITKFCDFHADMSTYYKTVQTILCTLGVNLGFMDSSDDPTSSLNKGSTTSTSKVSKLTFEEQLKGQGSHPGSGRPEMLDLYQLDMFQILTRRYMYQATGEMQNEVYTVDQFIGDQLGQKEADSGVGDDSNWSFRRFFGIDKEFATTVRLSAMFVGFKVERGIDTSESLNNQIGKSAIEGLINSKVSDMRSANYATGGFLQRSYQAATDVVAGVVKESGLGQLPILDKFTAGSLGLAGIGSLAMGSGFIDIPEVWEASSFTKNYTFSLKLRSPYGDPLSILRSEYVPLACILAGALPRAIGRNAYGSPFMIRAYCKGMFAVPMGMIDSMSIQRGRDLHGWSVQRLPTEITLNFSIKDMSGVMFMALNDDTGVTDVLGGENSSFQEYLATLSGLGMTDRLFIWRNMRRKMMIYGQQLKYASWLNPEYLAMRTAESPPVRMISNLLPIARYLPNN